MFVMTTGNLFLLWSQSQIGRPVVFSLAAEGEAGVRKVLQMLRDEFELTMALNGCRSLSEITRNHTLLPIGTLLNHLPRSWKRAWKRLQMNSLSQIEDIWLCFQESAFPLISSVFDILHVLWKRSEMTMDRCNFQKWQLIRLLFLWKFMRLYVGIQVSKIILLLWVIDFYQFLR